MFYSELKNYYTLRRNISSGDGFPASVLYIDSHETLSEEGTAVCQAQASNGTPDASFSLSSSFHWCFSFKNKS